MVPQKIVDKPEFKLKEKREKCKLIILLQFSFFVEFSYIIFWKSL